MGILRQYLSIKQRRDPIGCTNAELPILSPQNAHNPVKFLKQKLIFLCYLRYISELKEEELRQLVRENIKEILISDCLLLNENIQFVPSIQRSYEELTLEVRAINLLYHKNTCTFQFSVTCHSNG